MWINPFYETPTRTPILREVFPDWAHRGGIFDALYHEGDLPWESAVVDEILDVDYFGNRSGAKFPSPVVMQLLNDDGELADSSRYMLADIILAKFKEPWLHLWNTNVAAYEPLHNYSITESRQLAREDTRDSKDKASNVSQVNGSSVDQTNNDVYGFNSTDSVPSSKSDESSGSVTESTDASERDQNEKKKVGEVEELTRKGNIGVTTTQRLLEEERRLWLWNFFDQIYKDIDSVLSLPIYDICRV